ncbi:MAG: hypothetical protein CBB65_14310 [Hyphomonadaceae bacterium TMED5]|nr:transcriptional regulator [Ponticaulis sp.]OUX97238.1 MAG: hypothetical protein CBB65_14310 [Hyphomonadaceae bacterium TMED5]|tara:strand:- start:1182 stop:1721 length:540 start_codon:yes stop_codon:yes gene_type:complete
MQTETRLDFSGLSISRDQIGFLTELLAELMGLLQDAVGQEDAESFIAVVGSRMADRMNAEYLKNLGVSKLEADTLAAVLVDLKKRINGGFRIEALYPDRIVLANSRCPFGDFAVGRPALCMMTSNVFGRIAADNTGYAAVEIEDAIARGDANCRVIVYLTPVPMKRQIREYYPQGKLDV